MKYFYYFHLNLGEGHSHNTKVLSRGALFSFFRMFYLQFTFSFVFLLFNISLMYSQNTYNAGYGSGSGGVANVHVGNYSGRISTGYNNAFLGYYSGYYNTSGYFDVFIGVNAGLSNTTGTNNTFVGTRAGYSNTTVSFNSFVGSYSGYSNTTGSPNSFFGYYSGYSNTTGFRNTFLGTQSGFSNSTAANNTLVGYYAGYSGSSGSENTMVGSLTGSKNTTGSKNAYLGYNAGGSTSTGRENTFVGHSSGTNNTTGYGNTTVGFSAGTSSGTLTKSTAIGHRAYVTASNSLILGSVNGVNGATSTVKVGIGTTAPGYLLHVNGVAAKPGGGSWTVASDKRLKEEISPFKEGLSEVMNIQPVWFRYNGVAGMPRDKRYVGVIAQEMQKVAPHTVGEFVYQDLSGKEEKYLDYDPSSISFMLINAVKELKAENDQLKKELLEIKKSLDVPSSEGKPLSRLGQNYPNPYNKTTIIPYYVPENVGSAQIKILSVTGVEVYNHELSKGEGEIEISDKLLSSGTYIYQLIIDGRTIDNKKMVLTR